ncbi:MAG: biopolymer transport protein ExbD [Motiliproteus sp.]|jgi:biopolymer transport protein ExbD
MTAWRQSAWTSAPEPYMNRRRCQRRRQRHQVPEINITAFLNLMVVLIPFLLLTTAFNQLTILELYLPASNAADEQQLPDAPPELEVIIRAATLVINDRNQGPYLSLEASNGRFDYAAISRQLLTIKTRHPQLTHISLLAEPEVAYNQIIQVMDSARQTRTTAGPPRNIELFPDIVLGDAPAIEEAGTPSL